MNCKQIAAYFWTSSAFFFFLFFSDNTKTESKLSQVHGLSWTCRQCHAVTEMCYWHWSSSQTLLLPKPKMILLSLSRVRRIRYSSTVEPVVTDEPWCETPPPPAPTLRTTLSETFPSLLAGKWTPDQGPPTMNLKRAFGGVVFIWLVFEVRVPLLEECCMCR